MKRALLLLPVLVGAVVLAGTAAATGDGGVKTWRVTIENLTPVTSGPASSSQPLSPPLAVVHSKQADVWSPFHRASDGVAAIAEDADNSILEGALPGVPGVRSVQTFLNDNGPGVPPVIFSGDSLTFEVTTQGNENRLTLLSMLVNTNDAFTGLDSLQLHGKRGAQHVIAWDAGSELNDELATNIPGPCCGDTGKNGVATSDRILPSRGILGVGDLDRSTYDWRLLVAKISYERIG